MLVIALGTVKSGGVYRTPGTSFEVSDAEGHRLSGLNAVMIVKAEDEPQEPEQPKPERPKRRK